MAEHQTAVAAARAARRFPIFFLSFLVGLLASFLIIAFVVDPRGDFKAGLFSVVTRDSRTDKMALFDRLNGQGPVNGLIVGSSRSMEIAPQELQNRTGGTFFNFSVDSARAEDYLAIYRWARKHDAHLKVLLIGLDVEALHNDDQIDDRLAYNADLASALGLTHTGPVEVGLHKLHSLLTRYYAQDIVRSVRASFHAVPAMDVSLSLFDADGLHHYVQWERQVAQGTFNVESRIHESRDEYVRRFADMIALSERRRHYLETLLQEARTDGVVVRLWITPLHPSLASYLAKETHYADLLEQTQLYVRELENRYDVKTFDFSEPNHFGGNNVDWWDGAHVNLKNASRITHILASSLTKNGL